MSVTACEPMTAALTSLLSRPEVQVALRPVIESNASLSEQFAVLVRFAEPGIARSALAEFQELPELTATAILQSWNTAARAGKHFEVHSVRPSTPLEFARHKRVRITIDSEEDAVRVGLSHVPGRHAEWYAPAR